MLIRKKKSWELSENAVTPESVWLNRRSVLAGLGLTGAGAAAGALGLFPSRGMAADDPSAGLYPVPVNPAYADAGYALTAEKDAISYNNYYEFGSSKDIVKPAQKISIRPWTVEITGLVDTPKTWDIDELLAEMELEERIYRHRCVERWAMVVPWSGFPLRKLLARAGVQNDARYVKFTTFGDEKEARGIRQSPWYPWPYTEGITIDEAMHDLSFMVTGIYGKPLPKQNGAPLRVHLPWKYGFKSSKGIVRIEVTDKKPTGFWQQLQSSEYGFWANVNPSVPHRRWSQEMEWELTTRGTRPTSLYNGYAEEVASLYAPFADELGDDLFF